VAVVLKFIRSIALLCTTILSGYVNGQSLSTTEKQLIKNAEDGMPATLDLLERSVNINSGTFNIDGIKSVGDLYGKELKAMGFTVAWIRLPDSLQRAGHLVGYRKGKKGKKLLLIGHLDTVFEPDMPTNPYRLLNDSIATGQGVNDMKGGDVMIIACLKAMDAAGLLKESNITVYLTGDEENAGDPAWVSRGDFIARAKQHDIALSFEGAQGMNTVVTSRRGASEWKLEVEAQQAHSSGIFGKPGYGSVYEAARIINEFREQLSDERYLTFNPALFIGGSEVSYDSNAQKGRVTAKTNIIAPRSVVIGDLRFLTEDQKEDAREKMRQIVSKHLPGTNASISFKDGIPSMPPSPGNDSLLRAMNEINLALGYGTVVANDPASRGAGDISYIARYLACLDGLGASGSGAHAPGETINLKEYLQLIKRTTVLIYRLTR
jgi:glutamate carboxypeptidase